MVKVFDIKPLLFHLTDDNLWKNEVIRGAGNITASSSGIIVTMPSSDFNGRHSFPVPAIRTLLPPIPLILSLVGTKSVM